MKVKAASLSLSLLTLILCNIKAQDSTTLLIRQIESTLVFQEGLVNFETGNFTLDTPKELHFLDALQADYVLTNLYGNQTDSLLLGLLKSKDKGVLDPDAWVISITYHPVGHTGDEAYLPKGEKYWNDKQKEQFDSLNSIRLSLGLSPINFGGFRIVPMYIKENHTLHWAKVILFPGDEQLTLNFTGLKFGRVGYIKLNAVSSDNEYEEVKRSMMPMLDLIKFKPGFTFGDYQESDLIKSALNMENLVLGTKSVANNENKVWHWTKFLWFLLVFPAIFIIRLLFK